MPYLPPAPPYQGPAKFHGNSNNKPIRDIVLHGTVSPCEPGGARRIASYFRHSVRVPSSAHYVVDPEEVVQVVFDSVVAYHDGVNINSLGVELCDPVAKRDGRTPAPLRRWRSKNHTAMLELAANLVAELCLAYDVPVRMVGPRQLRRGKHGICDHDDRSKAFGKSSHWDLGNFPRRRFIRLVRAEVARLKGDQGTAKKEWRKANSRVTEAYDLLTLALKHAKRKVRRHRLANAIDWLEKMGVPE